MATTDIFCIPVRIHHQAYRNPSYEKLLALAEDAISFKRQNPGLTVSCQTMKEMLVDENNQTWHLVDDVWCKEWDLPLEENDFEEEYV